MKKILSLILSMVLLLTIIPMGVVSADTATDEPTVYVSDVKALVGSTVSVDVAVKNNPGILSMKLKISYDDAVLELTGKKTNNSTFPGISYGKNSNIPFIVNWVDTLNPNNTSNGIITTLTFKVKDEAELGKTPIVIDYDQSDVYGQDIDPDEGPLGPVYDVFFAKINGSVEVVECLHTDVTSYDAVASTCIEQGHGAYVYCNECENVIEGSNEKLPFAAHAIVYHEAKEATHLADGNYEYWQCSVCDTCFADANGNNVIDIKDVTIQKIPHVYDDIYDLECECGYVRQLVSISVDELPTKSVYLIGQTLCPVGMVVTAHYDDDTFGAVEGYAVGEFDSKTAGKKQVIVTYNDKEASFEATVIPADTAAFVVEDKRVKTDGTFIIEVSTVNNPGITSAHLQIGYDADVLELVDKAEKDFVGVEYGPINNNPFDVNWVDTLEPNNTTNGAITVLTFKVKDPEALGKTLITVSYDPENVFDENYDNVNFETVYGVIDVTKYTLCDVNDDGKINNKDLGVLMQYLNGWDIQIIIEAADVNGDGKVNNKDYGMLMQKLNGWDI